MDSADFSDVNGIAIAVLSFLISTCSRVTIILNSGRIPMKEYRPTIVPLSTLSKRHLAPCFFSFKYAETGVSKSAGMDDEITFN